MGPERLANEPLWMANNQHTIVINFHQDFVASMHSNIFQGQMDGGQNMSGKLSCRI